MRNDFHIILGGVGGVSVCTRLKNVVSIAAEAYKYAGLISKSVIQRTYLRRIFRGAFEVDTRVRAPMEKPDRTGK
jgi:hypothetical protein